MAGSGGQASTVFENVRVFDGQSDQLSEPVSVLVSGNVIGSVGTQPSAPEAGEQRIVIDGRGRVLMPGLIDAHAHVMIATIPAAGAILADREYLGVRGALAARDMLMRGFTSVRDTGGPAFGVKRAIDEGLTPGPRIWPSGALISQTAGRGDFRLPYETPRGMCGHLAHTEQAGMAVIADGVDEVLRGVREQLMTAPARSR